MIARRADFAAPTEPAPSRWALRSPADTQDGQDLVALGADLEPGTMVAGYRAGLFPMGVGTEGRDPLGWWSPDPRGVIGPGDLHVSRSLSRSLRRFDVTIDADLGGVLAGCADPRRSGSWITDDLISAYRQLHTLGFVHSVEVWSEDTLVGGLFGVAIGGLFAGESMFMAATDASKAALVTLVRHLESVAGPDDTRPGTAWLVDVQWCTDHLARMGARTISRQSYLSRLPSLLGGAHLWPSPVRHSAPTGPRG